MPSEAKNNKNLVFGDKYEDIFSEDSITASRMLMPLRIYEPLQIIKSDIQWRKRRREPINEQEAYVSRAVFHILNAVRIIGDHENLDLTQEASINTAIKKAVSYINEVIDRESASRGSVYTHDKFFKEVQTNSLIQKHVEGKYGIVSN